MKKIITIGTALSLVILAIIFALSTSRESFKKGPLPSPTTVPLSYPSPGVPLKPGAGSEPEEYQRAEEEFVKSHPILQRLPVDSLYFGIEYKSEKHLIIHSKTNDKERDYGESKKWFVQNRVDPTGIRIEYK